MAPTKETKAPSKCFRKGSYYDAPNRIVGKLIQIAPCCAETVGLTFPHFNCEIKSDNANPTPYMRTAKRPTALASANQSITVKQDCLVDQMISEFVQTYEALTPSACNAVASKNDIPQSSSNQFHESHASATKSTWHSNQSVCEEPQGSTHVSTILDWFPKRFLQIPDSGKSQRIHVQDWFLL